MVHILFAWKMSMTLVDNDRLFITYPLPSTIAFSLLSVVWNIRLPKAPINTLPPGSVNVPNLCLLLTWVRNPAPLILHKSLGKAESLVCAYHSKRPCPPTFPWCPYPVINPPAPLLPPPPVQSRPHLELFNNNILASIQLLIPSQIHLSFQ